MSLYFLRFVRKAGKRHAALTGVFVAVTLLSFTGERVWAQNEWHLSNDFSYTYNDVSGPGSDQSSLTEGFRYMEVMNLNGSGTADGIDYHFNTGFRLTDDPRNDIRNFALTTLQGRLSKEAHEVSFGDVFQPFSQYSMATAVKGGAYKLTGAEGLPEVTLIYGYANPRWDNFWDLGYGRVDAITRQAYGGRVQQKLADDFTAGFSVVRSYDSDRVFNTDTLYDSFSTTLDWEYLPIPGLSIRGESSFSDTTESPAADERDTKYHGYAHRLTAVGSGGPSRVTLEYERVSPNFLTVLGAATPDREKIKANWRYKISKLTTVTSRFLWYHDDLDGQKSYRTDYYRPEISLTQKRLFDRRYAVADLSYRLSIKERARETTSRVDHIVNLGYRDRFGIFDSDTNVGLTSYDYRDATRARTTEYVYNTALSSRHTLGKVILKPSVMLGGWTTRQELEDTDDQIIEHSLGLGCDIPSWKVTSSIKVGQNYLLRSEGEDSARTFANMHLYYRPEFLSKLNYGMIFVRASMNDFVYDNGTRDFRETSITAGLNIQY